MKKESKAKSAASSKTFSDFPIYKIEKENFHKYKLFQKFLEINDCPKEIYYRGNIPENFGHTLSVVGSRAVTDYGRTALEKVFENLAGHNLTIISGLAIGVDGLAHMHALEIGLPVIAIPGSGLSEKVLYPRSNKDLALKILQTGGLLLSELPPEYMPASWTFPSRNRLMAALSDKILLVEAAEKSGTLITARLALDYNKDVLCIPGSIFSSRSSGTNKLIQEGAAMILESDDILKEFRIKIEVDEDDNVKNSTPKNLTNDEEKIYYLLDPENTKEKILEITNMDISDFLMSLTMLEMKGYVEVNGSLVRRKK